MRTALLLLIIASPALAEEQRSRPLSIGINYLGGQLDLDVGRGKRLEARLITGEQSTEQGRVSATLIGIRGYQLFRAQGAYHPYFGVEGAYVSADTRGSSVYHVSGVAAGVFAGLERKVTSLVSIGLDAGPYLFMVSERDTGASSSNVDIVANAYVLFRLFGR